MAKINSKIKKGYIVSGIVLVLVIIFFVGKIFIENKVKNELLKLLNNDPESLYEINFSKVSLNLFTGNFKVKDINVSPRERSLQQFGEGNIPKLINSKIEKFKIINLGIIDFLRTKNLDISSIELNNIEIEYFLNSQKGKSEKTNTLALHNIFSKDFVGIKLGSININNSILKFYNAPDMENPFLEIDSVFVSFDDILLNPETLQNAIPITFSDLTIKAGQFELSSMKYYNIQTSNVHFVVKDTSLIIEGFKLIPKYSRNEFNKKIKYNDDLFNIKTDKIIFTGLNLKELEFTDVLSFQKVEVEKPDISIYRDKRLPDAPFKYKPLITSLLKKISFAFYIDTLLVKNGKLVYEEQVNLSDKPGKVFFDPLHITAYHITNVEDIINQDPLLQVDFSGKIMAVSQLEAHIDFDLARNDDYFEMNGSLEAISGVEFNPMLQHLTLTRIISCDVQKAEFSFSANDDYSQGNLILDYINLEGELLKAKDETKKSGFLTWAAKGVITKSNTPEDKKYRSGTIFCYRRKDRGIINYLWNSSKSGIISIVTPIADKTKKQMKAETANEESSKEKGLFRKKGKK